MEVLGRIHSTKLKTRILTQHGAKHHKKLYDIQYDVDIGEVLGNSIMMLKDFKTVRAND